jgi:hypothetical protein
MIDALEAQDKADRQHLLKRVHPSATERQSLNQEFGWKDGVRGGQLKGKDSL